MGIQKHTAVNFQLFAPEILLDIEQNHETLVQIVSNYQEYKKIMRQCLDDV